MFLWVKVGSGPAEPLKVCSGRDDPGMHIPKSGVGGGVPGQVSPAQGTGKISLSSQPEPKQNLLEIPSRVL